MGDLWEIGEENGDKWGYLDVWARDTFNKNYFGFDGVMMTSSISVGTGSTYNSTTVKTCW